MAVPKKKSSKTRTNRRYRTWVKKEQKRLTSQLVLVPYGNGSELKPAHIYLDDGADMRKMKKTPKAAPKAEPTDATEAKSEKKPAPKKATKKKSTKDAE